ncbi:MAG: sigma-54 dependent transcriptional regulator [Acidobacteriota bacterium]
MSSETIRLVHWDAGVRRRWRAALTHLPAQVLDSGNWAGEIASDRQVLVIGDPGGGTPAALELIGKYSRPETAVIIVVSNGDSCEDFAISALDLGVRAYIREPVANESLADAVRRVLHPPAAEPAGDLGLVGESETMERLRRQIRMAARVNSTVLVTGESGTGKELTACTVHLLSNRTGRLVTLNCAAIPDSLLESELFGYERGAFTGAYRSEPGKMAEADGGTLFLDEIGELSASAQAKLLRTIEIKEVQRLGSHKFSKVDVRVVAATNRRLEEMVAQGKFREDLYYRINVIQIHMAPLRERKSDIPLISAHCIRELNSRFQQRVETIDDAVRERLSKYHWPGNVRELRNLLEATCVGSPGPTIRFEHLPDYYQRRITALDEAPVAMSERHRLLAALNTTQWNKSKAAEQLRWSRVTLYRKLAKYGIADPAPGG